MNTLLQRNPIVFLLTQGWHYAGRYRRCIPLCMLIFAAAQAALLAEPYIVGQLLNSVQLRDKQPSALMEDILRNLMILFGLQFSFWMFHGPGRLIEQYVAFRIKLHYRTALFRMITSLPLEWHRQHHSGESIDKLNRAASSLGTFFDDGFDLCYMIFRVVGAHAMLFCFLPFSGVMAFIITLTAGAFVMRFEGILAGQYGALNKFENQVASVVHDYITNVESVITLRLENQTFNEVTRRILAQVSILVKSNSINEFKWFITTMIIATMMVIVLGYYTYSVLSVGQVLMAGTFLTLFEYVRRIGDSFYDFSRLYGLFVRQAENVRSAETIVSAASKLVERSDQCNLPVTWKTLSVTNLNFAYEDAEFGKQHLDDVAIDLVRGRSIALVGESGSGKSTLLTLLRGLQVPDSVTVCCDGVTLPQGLDHLIGSTTLLPQDPQLFNDSIEFNVTFGVELGAGAIEEALCLARFTPVLERLPDGLQTNIAEKGVNLSGGEKQRLALARGLFFAKESEIVLLDEPTSSVDTYNERLIYTNVLSQFKEKCLVSSIHKLHLLDLFDHIYVLDGGRVVESGDFHTLVMRDGVLSRLWRNYQVGTGEPTAFGAPASEAPASEARNSGAPASRRHSGARASSPHS